MLQTQQTKKPGGRGNKLSEGEKAKNLGISGYVSHKTRIRKMQRFLSQQTNRKIGYGEAGRYILDDYFRLKKLVDEIDVDAIELPEAA
jgi:hypothetical protein